MISSGGGILGGIFLGSTFYAFPLSARGESFLLRTQSAGQPKSIVVDAGYAGTGPGSLFGAITREAPDLKGIDRLICTHEDADHCGGMPDFIRAWMESDRAIEQLWLPAIWSAGGAGRARKGWMTSEIVDGAFQAAPAIAERLESLQDRFDISEQNPDRAIEMVRLAAQEVAYSNAGLSRILEGAEETEADDASFEFGNLLSTVLGPFGSQFGDISGDSEWVEPASRVDFCLKSLISAVSRSIISPPITAGFFIQNQGAMAMILANDALRTHERIAPIIATAMHWKIPIRWFDFGRFRKTQVARGGDQKFLTPVNAVEVAGTKGAVGAVLRFLALTLSRANAESLVFLRHERTAEAPVLFTADSRLAFGSDRARRNFPKPNVGLPCRGRLLATAFHHGAANNDHAYGVLKGWLGTASPVLYIRNGGAHIKGIAPSFLAADRLCVTCHRSTDAPRLVRVEASAGDWQIPTHRVPCTCA